MVLFTEVPGCSTVRGYASRVLRHRLIVEAAETLFVPVVVHNNTGGADRELLRSFGEASWNNPALRIIDTNGRALAPRLYGDYSVGATARTMQGALKRAGKPVPRYLSQLVAELSAKRARAVYAMACFWSGEAGLGGLDGVLATRAGFAAGHEVVEVIYDSKRLSKATLDAHARRHVAARPLGSVQVRTAPAKDQLYYLRRSRWRHVSGLTALQRTRINAALAQRKSPTTYASPRQQAALKSPR
jgi:hypothetical protein